MLKLLPRVKGHLEIPQDDTSEDGRLGETLESATELILELTRWAHEDETGRQDIFTNAQMGRVFHLTRRPVAAITTSEVKHIGEDFESVDVELIDPTKGNFQLHRITSGWPPPRHYNAAPYFRHREVIWDVMRITYNVTGTEPESRIKNAIVGLTVYHVRQISAGAAKDAAIGSLRESYREEGLPDHIMAMIADHVEEGCASWVA